MKTLHGGIVVVDKSEKEALVAECRASGITAKEWL